MITLHPKILFKASAVAFALILSAGASAQNIGFSVGGANPSAQIIFRSGHTPTVVHSYYAPAPYLEAIPAMGFGWTWEPGRWIRHEHHSYRWIPGRAVYVGPPLFTSAMTFIITTIAITSITSAMTIDTIHTIHTIYTIDTIDTIMVSQTGITDRP